jgi:hypothetical protein
MKEIFPTLLPMTIDAASATQLFTYHSAYAPFYQAHERFDLKEKFRQELAKSLRQQDVVDFQLMPLESLDEEQMIGTVLIEVVTAHDFKEINIGQIINSICQMALHKL